MTEMRGQGHGSDFQEARRGKLDEPDRFGQGRAGPGTGVGCRLPELDALSLMSAVRDELTCWALGHTQAA